MSNIDFVIPWVDGSDPAWRAVKRQYQPGAHADDAEHRFRDWDLLRFWFRGVEAFAPWVHRVHFVTWGHLPPWLNTRHPKLHIVRHEDYLPQRYRPTFSANPIELNLHRIPGLTEQFVYFNDDMFLIRPVQPSLFFRKGLPCDDGIFSPIIAAARHNDGGMFTATSMCVINTHFTKRQVLRTAPHKWFCPLYGSMLLRTLCVLPWRHLVGFYNDHLPQPFLKSTYEAVWAAEGDLLDEVSTHRFRDSGHDLNQWLMRYWQLCQNRFHPVSPRRGTALHIDDPRACTAIRSQRYAMLCLNDMPDIPCAETVQAAVQAAFLHILPTPCTYERS